jgi:hypothetical protein
MHDRIASLIFLSLHTRILSLWSDCFTRSWIQNHVSHFDQIALLLFLSLRIPILSLCSACFPRSGFQNRSSLFSQTALRILDHYLGNGHFIKNFLNTWKPRGKNDDHIHVPYYGPRSSFLKIFFEILTLLSHTFGSNMKHHWLLHWEQNILRHTVRELCANGATTTWICVHEVLHVHGKLHMGLRKDLLTQVKFLCAHQPSHRRRKNTGDSGSHERKIKRDCNYQKHLLSVSQNSNHVHWVRRENVKRRTLSISLASNGVFDLPVDQSAFQLTSINRESNFIMYLK